MATFKYGSGAVTAAKRVVVGDAFVQDGKVEVEILQPAGTILDEIIVRFVKGVTMATASDLGYQLGTSSGNAEIAVNPDGFLDEGTSVAKNTIYYLANGGGAGNFQPESLMDHTVGNAALGWSDDDRKLYFQTRCTDDVISSNGEIELNFVFKHLV